MTEAVLADILARHAGREGALLPILHDVQAALGCVPADALQPIADALNLSRAEVHGVVSFYHDFRERPAAKPVVKLCRAEACQARGVGALLAQAEAHPGVTVEPVYCLGLCASGPAAMAGDRVFARLDAAGLGRLLDEVATSVLPLRGEARDAPLGAARVGVLGDTAAPASVAWPTTPTRRAEDAASRLPPQGEDKLRIFVPGDAAALAVGADAVAAALALALPAATIVRSGSRGMFDLEPLVEVETAAGRIGYARVTADDAASLATTLAATGAHPACIGLVEDLPFLKRQTRLTFARCGISDPQSLADYGPWRGLARARQIGPDAIIAAVTASGLRGRGGAGFPTGIKWRTVADALAAQKYIVCNADEGDSGTFADRMLMEGDPFLLIEGMAIAGFAVGAAHGYIYIRSEYPYAIKAIDRAIATARGAGLLGGFDLEVRVGAGSYVCGEETALLESLEGKRGQVRAKPPLPAHKGLFGQPTVINNLLSLAAVPFILAEGAAAYAALGTGRSRGTMPIQLAGNIRHGGLVEVAFGVTLGELVNDIGGGTASGRPVKAVQVGGPLGAYHPPSDFGLAFDYEAFTAANGLIGHGGVVVFDDTADMGTQARFAMEFCAIESCGKCTPCRLGAQRGVEVLDRIRAGVDVAANLTLIEDLCETMQFGSLCALGGLTPVPVRSAMRHWPEDFSS